MLLIAFLFLEPVFCVYSLFYCECREIMPPGHRTLFVGGLPREMREREIEKIWGKYGDVKKIHGKYGLPTYLWCIALFRVSFEATKAPQSLANEKYAPQFTHE